MSAEYRSVHVSTVNDGGPGHSGDERVEDAAAAVGDAPGADLRVRDIGPGGEPGLHGADVGDLAWAVDSDEPTRLAVRRGHRR